MTIKRPMLAAALQDRKAVKYPVLATPKFDGIRCVKVDGQALSRSLKSIPNLYIRSHIEHEYIPDGYDGELMLFSGSFQDTVSAIMSVKGAPDFIWRVFDHCNALPYHQRAESLHTFGPRVSWIEFVRPVLIENETQLQAYIDKCLEAGHEGVCFRQPNSPYKMGRSTEKEGYLIKYKPIETADAIVFGFEEKLTNTNAQTTNALGLSERSHESAGKIPAGTLGALKVRSLDGSMVFNIGSGFTDNARHIIWKNRDSLVGRVVEYKHQPIGVLHAPRCPVFFRFRENIEHLINP